MPGSLSFGLNKNLDSSVVITDLPTYKVINSAAPVFDLTTNVVIGTLFGQKQISKDGKGNALGALYTYNVTFVPATNVTGGMSFVFAYKANELVAGGESELAGTYVAPIRSSVSSGVFLNENGTTIKVKDSTDIRKYYVNFPYGYANGISSIQSPSALNTPEYLVLSSIDTPSWVIGSDPTELVCVENGKWAILSQYQLIGIAPGVGTLNGWFNVNGVDVPNSDAENVTTGENENNVLPIQFAQYFNKGDKVKFGISSSNFDGSSTLRAVCKTTNNSPSGITTPAVIITCSRLL
jgi:hypothetical protein